MEFFSWVCPYCDHHASIGTPDLLCNSIEFAIDNSDGPRRFDFKFIVCPNPECKKFTLTAELYKAARVHPTLPPGSPPSIATVRDRKKDSLLHKWNLVPPSKAKIFPDYIPKVIINDYSEACLIADLSPKASATLSRRCLQGILRDFWQVKPANLNKEIEQIKDKVSTEVWDGIEVVRTVGNIGAHMEKDVNLIIEVDSEEAMLLISLIEILIQEWYVEREQRKARLKQIKELGETKRKAKNGKETKAESNAT